MATKRLKELLEARKSSARDNSGMLVNFKYIVPEACDLEPHCFC
jgi:hypothetical protein